MEKNLKQNLEMFKTEIEAAVSGFNQEIKEMILKYKESTGISGAIFDMLVDDTNKVKCVTTFVPDEALVPMLEAYESDQTQDENSYNDVELLDNQVEVAKVYRNTQSEAVLFATHHLKH